VRDKTRGLVDELKPAGCRNVQLHVLVFRDEQYHTRSDRCGCGASEADQRQGGAAVVHLWGHDSHLDLLQLDRLLSFLTAWRNRGSAGETAGELHVLDIHVGGVLLAVDVSHQYLQY